MFFDFESEIKGVGIECKVNELLSLRSSFKIGGPASLMVFPRTKNEMIIVLDAATKHNLKFAVVGNGSNILFDDAGYEGVIISTIHMGAMQISGTAMWAECGASFTAMALAAAKSNLTGLEFAYGIPGSCGGAVFMNAGAYGSEMSAVIRSAECYDITNKKVVNLDKDELEMSYRRSVFMDKKELIILSAAIDLKLGDRSAIHDTMMKNKQSREEKQPLKMPNAGSIFKRHELGAVSKMIDECGLKGYRIGGAQVSEKHAGFIVNCGGATSADVLSLIAHIKKIIAEKYGFEPECEIRYIR